MSGVRGVRKEPKKPGRRQNRVERAQARMTAAERDIATAVEDAIRIVGFQSELARQIGFTHNAIYLARRRAIVSPQMAKAIEIATQGRVSMARLCPHFFDQLQSIETTRRIIPKRASPKSTAKKRERNHGRRDARA